MGAERERDGEEQRRPLLSSSSSSSSPPASLAAAEQHQQQYQFLGRSSSSVLRGVGGSGGLGWGGPEVSADEVRSAAPFSSSAGSYPPPPQALASLEDRVYPYPPSIHSAVLSPSPSPSPSHAPSPPHPNEGLAIVPQGPYPYGSGGYQPSERIARDVLDEVEIRQLLSDHVGHRCCWGKSSCLHVENYLHRGLQCLCWDSGNISSRRET